MKFFFLSLLSLVLLASSSLCEDLVLSVDDKGVIIDSLGVGPLVLAAPTLSMAEDDYQGQQPEQPTREGNETLLARYPAGLEVRITVDPAKKTVTYDLSAVPAAKGLRFGMLIPLDLQKREGQFSFDSGPLQPLPKTKGAQHMFSGQAKTFQLVAEGGKGFVVAPPASWQALQDNRFFGWEIYEYQFLYDFASHPDRTSFSFTFEPIGY